MTRITIVMSNENGRRFAIAHEVDPHKAVFSRDPTSDVTIRIGFESITIARVELTNLFRAVEAARASGSEYPEDWKQFYGLEPDQ